MWHLRVVVLIGLGAVLACGGREEPAAAKPEEGRRARPALPFAAAAARSEVPSPAPAPLAEPLLLDPLAPGTALGIRVAGHDPAGPRPLWLWRLRGDATSVVARTESGAEGRFVFPPLAVPGTGLELVATPAGGAPGSDSASASLRVAARAPALPRVSRLAQEGDWITLRVDPVSPSGAIVLADPQGREFARFAIASSPDRARRSLELAVAPAPGQRTLWLAHEAPDGRRSDWLPFHLDDPLHRRSEGGSTHGMD